MGPCGALLPLFPDPGSPHYSFPTHRREVLRLAPRLYDFARSGLSLNSTVPRATGRAQSARRAAEDRAFRCGSRSRAARRTWSSTKPRDGAAACRAAVMTLRSALSRRSWAACHVSQPPRRAARGRPRTGPGELARFVSPRVGEHSGRWSNLARWGDRRRHRGGVVGEQSAMAFDLLWELRRRASWVVTRARGMGLSAPRFRSRPACDAMVSAFGSVAGSIVTISEVEGDRSRATPQRWARGRRPRPTFASESGSRRGELRVAWERRFSRRRQRRGQPRLELARRHVTPRRPGGATTDEARAKLLEALERRQRQHEIVRTLCEPMPR